MTNESAYPRTAALEQKPVHELSTNELVDVLLVRIMLTNGLEAPFTSEEQLLALYNQIEGELQRRGLMGG